MIPGLGGMNPKQMEQMMRQMGINQTPVNAARVIIEKNDGSKLVVDPAQVVMIEMRGQKSLQVSGEFNEQAAGESAETQDDAALVAEQAGVSREKAVEALKKADGDIAEAIMLLENGH